MLNNNINMIPNNIKLGVSIETENPEKLPFHVMGPWT